VKAWAVVAPGSPIQRSDRPIPAPAAGELLLRVRACGVCRTDLHLADGDLPPRRPATVPGHEIVGEVVETGAEVTDFSLGERVGVAWLRSTDRLCKYCRRGDENLCPRSTYTGWDADGGYAEYCVAPAGYVYRLPEHYGDAEVAPLLCAGIIGYRALRQANLPTGGRLGVYGFGGSAHLAAQVAVQEGATVHVVTRSPRARELALSLGVASAGDVPPEPLDSAILFAPAGELVPVALAALDRGGTLAIAGIYLSGIPALRYEDHLFYEKALRSVTANTREDGRAFLDHANQHRLKVAVDERPLDAADQALLDLAGGRVAGAAVLLP
jgi:propanol-preferring alcohol dehydrogenase